MSIANDARRLHPELASLRRALHSDPEIGLDLPRTQEKVLRELRTLPLEVSTGTGCSSVVGVLRGTKARPGQRPATVLLRADMDALPLQEELDVPFASQRPGVMHACGHDLHTAMLAGAARLLSARREEFSGSVVFMFQPGEESRHGARVMIDEGVLEAAGAPADAVYALHVFSGLVPHGQFFTRPGPMLASSDEARVIITGKGGHGSAPHLARDPVAAAAELVTSLQVMVTRRFDVFDPIVVTVGFLQAGTKANIIPASATFHATVRTFTPATRQRARTEIQRLVHHVALGYGLSADVEYIEGYPPTVNDEAEVAFAVETINAQFGPGRCIIWPHALTAAEDFSYVLRSTPGAFVGLGAAAVGADLAAVADNHAPDAAFDDAVLADGATLYAQLALGRLSRRSAAASHQ